ncbi:hypothetical protein B0H14DRAFT_3042359 [Mycena olivaceomarginata]|nr:hypothetical protein B0H14DRAFT_3042359 [Mycena olivaceomarginata]
MSLTLSSVNLATLAIGSVFYSMYSVLFAISMYLLLRRHTATNPSRKAASVFTSVIFLSAIVLFLVVTGHWTMIVYRAFHAFLSFQNGSETELFYLNNIQLTYRAMNILTTTSIVIGDALIIHRLWVVWAKSRLVVVFPICSVIAFIVGSGISTHCVELSRTIFSDPWLTASIIMTLVNNIYCTALISWRIWATTKLSIASDGINLRKFLPILVESAGIYAFWVIFFTVTYQTNSNLGSSVLETAPAIIGIVNALIHTRVGLGWTSEPNQGPSTELIFAGLSMSVEDR